jgi:hypothetical protein
LAKATGDGRVEVEGAEEFTGGVGLIFIFSGMSY